jgi:hypothetical protein
VLVGIEEAVLVTLFSLYTFRPDIVSNLNLDFYMVCAIFLLEFIYEIYKWVEFFKAGRENEQVTPINPKKGSVPVNSFVQENSLDDIEYNLSSQKKLPQVSPYMDGKKSTYEPVRKKR